MKTLLYSLALVLIAGCTSSNEITQTAEATSEEMTEEMVTAMETTAAEKQHVSEIKQMVATMFDGMRAGDSSAVASVLHKDASFRSVAYRQGAPVVFMGDRDGFVTAVGTPHDEVWDEKIWGLEVRVDDPLATAWMNYAFYLDETLSHCGVNAMQLFNSDSGWQIVSITDSRRREGCGPQSE